VIVAPFKAEGSGAPDLFSLGLYSEAVDPSADLARAAASRARLLLGHDAITDWTLPASLRPWDIPFLEYYRVPQETIEHSVNRWYAQTVGLLNNWRGDCGCIPMFYTQNRWTMAEVLAGLRALDALVNLSPRMKVIAPFAFLRANGINVSPELRAAFTSLLQAGAAAGIATLTPIGSGPSLPPKGGTPTPKPTPVPAPKPASLFVTVHAFTLGGSMQTERGGLRGPQGKFLRVLPGTQGQGMWPDSFKVACDADAPTGDAEWEITQLEGGDAGHFSIRSVPNGECYFGADAGKFTTDACHQYYTAPSVRGALEKPYGVTWPNGSKVLACAHDEGNLTASLTWVKA